MRTVAIGALIAAACSSSPTAGGGGGGMMSGPSVSAVDYAFSPETMTVTLGSTVTSTNSGATTTTGWSGRSR